MKTTLLAAATTALLLLFLASTGMADRLHGVEAGYLVLCAYLLIFAFGRVLATRRTGRAPALAADQQTATETAAPTAVSTSAPAPITTAPVHADDEGPVIIGGQQYSIRADPGYLAHVGAEFEPHLSRLYQLIASEARVVLDVGANVGCTTILFSRLARKVHAFEPSGATFALLEENLGRAGAVSNVDLHRFALGKDPGTVEMVSSPSFRAGSFVGSLSEVSVGHIAEQVTVRTIDDVADEFQIKDVDFIKIDTEGYDGEVVHGARAVLSSNSPVAVLELNHWCLNVYRRQSVPDYLDHLRSVFPLLFALSSDGQTYLNLHDKDDRYVVMYRHILHGDYSNLLGAFDESRLRTFFSAYKCRIPG